MRDRPTRPVALTRPAKRQAGRAGLGCSPGQARLQATRCGLGKQQYPDSAQKLLQPSRCEPIDLRNPREEVAPVARAQGVRQRLRWAQVIVQGATTAVAFGPPLRAQALVVLRAGPDASQRASQTHSVDSSIEGQSLVYRKRSAIGPSMGRACSGMSRQTAAASESSPASSSTSASITFAEGKAGSRVDHRRASATAFSGERSSGMGDDR